MTIITNWQQIYAQCIQMVYHQTRAGLHPPIHSAEGSSRLDADQIQDLNQF